MKKHMKRLQKSLSHAHQGIWHTLLTQPNMLIHIFIAILTTLAAWWLNFSYLEWAILILTITLILILEMINTTAETIVDLVSPNYHELAKIAKDVSAGAVLIGSIGSIIIGILLFSHHLL